MISSPRCFSVGGLVGVLALGLILSTSVIVQAAGKQAASTADTPADQAKFDKFLDDHPETADALLLHPGRADNPEFLKNHPEYATFIKNHPNVAASVKAHPREFVDRFLKREDDTAITRGQAKDFGDFLEAHPAVEKDLAEDPALLKNAKFLKEHPELHEFLLQHPGIAGFAEAKPVRLFTRAQIARGKHPN